MSDSEDGFIETGDAESGSGNQIHTVGVQFKNDEDRRNELHSRRLLLAQVSYGVGILMIGGGAALAYLYSGDLWGQRDVFLEERHPIPRLAELRLFLIAYMTFKASFVVGLFTAGGLLLKGAKSAMRPPLYPPPKI